MRDPFAWPRGPFPVARGWVPASLYAEGSGLALDPSRIETLMQDAAGTVPVTAPGQPVGLVRDRSLRANGASQSVSAARPTLGRHPRSGIRNLLSNSRALASLGWAGGSGLLSTVDAGALGLSGQMTASLLIENSTASSARNRVQGVNVLNGQFYTMSAIVKSVGPQTRHVHLVFENGTAFSGSPNATLNMLTGVVTQTSGVGRTAGADNLGNGWWRVWLRAQCVADGLNGFRVGFSDSPTSPWGSYTGDGASGIAVDGVQVETGAGMTAYQNVTSAFDVTEAGVPDLYYLSFDGVDDWLTTANIPLAAGGRTIIAAVRKRSDAAAGAIVETQPMWTSAGGGVAQFAPSASGPATYGSRILTSAVQSLVNTPASFAAPHTAVMSSVMVPESHIVRINGQQVASDAPAGTIPALTAALAIGSRAGSSFFARIDLYGLIVIDRVLTAQELALAEAWAAAKCGVVL